jgi:hypothetical protein
MRTAKWLLSPVSRDKSSRIGVATLTISISSGELAERKQRTTNAIALGVFFPTDVTKRNHRFYEVERRGVVQSDALAQVREADAFTMSGDLFQDAEGPACD